MEIKDNIILCKSVNRVQKILSLNLGFLFSRTHCTIDLIHESITANTIDYMSGAQEWRPISTIK